MSFTNGNELVAGEATGDVCESALRRIQIREALDAAEPTEEAGWGILNHRQLKAIAI